MRPDDFPKTIKCYWRYTYQEIVDDHAVGDPFLGLKTANAKERGIVKKGKYGCLVLNKYPYAPGHMLAVPYRQVGDLENLTKSEMKELMELVVLGKKLVDSVLNADASNIGLNQGDRSVSGGSVPMHLHWHIVPRWKGDHSYFTIMADTRLLIRSQENVCEAFVKEVRKMEREAAKKSTKKAASPKKKAAAKAKR